MADIVDHHLLESPAATAATTSSVVDDDGEEESFTFAAVSPLAVVDGFPDDNGRIGHVYPVFGRPRSPALQEQEEDPASSATVRVPLGQLLLEERGSSSPGQPDDDGGELDSVPAGTYCLWSPGGSPPAAAGSDQSPARCGKSGSTGSALRWRRRLLGRSNSDGNGKDDKFVNILNLISSERNAKEGDCHGGRRSPFLPCDKKDLVGLLANAGAFRRSYHPF